MKKLVLLLTVILIALCLTSCGEEDSGKGFYYEVNQDGKTCTITDIDNDYYFPEWLEWLEVIIEQIQTEKKHLKIPKKINGYTVTSIGDSAFYECYSLTSVTIPDSVTSIGYAVFSNCDSLTSIVVDENNQYYKSTDGNLYSKDGSTLIQYAVGKLDNNFTIPDSVISIGDYAFCICQSLTSVTIPDSVTSIGSQAFSQCTSLTSVTIPDSVTSIGDSAFNDCYSLTSVTIPDSVTSIGSRAFLGCDSLTPVTIPDSVTSIGDYAFSSCDSLTSIVIPSSVTSIGNSAFYNSTSLTIYCEAEAKPDGWDENWNISNRPVVWGWKGE